MEQSTANHPLSSGSPAAAAGEISILRRTVAALGGGILLALSFPPYNLPWLLPVGIAMFAWALEGLGLRKSFWLGMVCGIPYFGGTLFWLVNVFPVRAPALILIAALFPALFAVCYSLLRRHGPRLPISLAMAFCWTAVEFFRSELFPLAFGWMGLGYGAVNLPLIAQLARVFGSYGLTFLIVAVGVRLVFPPTFVPWKKTFVLVVAVLWFITAAIPMPKPPQPETPIRVRLVQENTGSVDDYVTLSPSGDSAPDLIVWPEYSVLVNRAHPGKSWERIVALARESNAYVVFGTVEHAQHKQEWYNVAYVISPKGTLAGRHHKNHTVYFMSDGVPGATADAIDSELGGMGVAICFDMDFPDVARQLTQDGAEFFVVPNMDPVEWGAVQREQHQLLFQMRALECGRWLARADVAGGTSVCAPTGHVTDSVSTTLPIALDAEIGRRSVITPYVAGGWYFGWVVFIGTAVLLIVSGIRGVWRWRAEKHS